ncbi:MAG: hypothetical protein JWM39_436 [Parcubacteria group bacterium]|nr:hypothetical protein [Parcubacteria group bacterium]
MNPLGDLWGETAKSLLLCKAVPVVFRDMPERRSSRLVTAGPDRWSSLRKQDRIRLIGSVQKHEETYPLGGFLRFYMLWFSIHIVSIEVSYRTYT